MTTIDFNETVEIHGREFQRYSIENVVYLVPVDLEEEERLDRQHKLFYYIFGQRHYFPAIGQPARILDCGYGQGQWAIQMATDFPDSEVVAYDMYPVELELEDGPDNISIEIVDLNHRLGLREGEAPFDFIHSRCLNGGIKKNRWDSYIRDLRSMLRRDGWIQLAEYYLNFQSSNGSLTEDHGLRKWSAMYLQVMDNFFNHDPRVGPRLADKLRAQRFRHVRSAQYNIPIAAWAEGDDAVADMQRRIGNENIANISSLLDSHAIWPFTNAGPNCWSEQNVRDCNAWAKQEITRKDLKLYVVLYVAWGQR